MSENNVPTTVDLSAIQEEIDLRYGVKKDGAIQVWRDTFAYRNKSKFQNCKGVEVIQKFKILKTQLATTLVRQLIIY